MSKQFDLKAWAKQTGHHSAADPAALRKAHSLEDHADDLERKAASMGTQKGAAKAWSDAADAFDVAADAYEEAPLIQTAENMKKQANRCRVQAMGHASSEKKMK